MTITVLVLGDQAVDKDLALRAVTCGKPQMLRLREPRDDGSPVDAHLSYASVPLDWQRELSIVAVPAHRPVARALMQRTQEGLLGALLLIKHCPPASVSSLVQYLVDYRPLAERGALVVGISSLSSHDVRSMVSYEGAAQAMGLSLPVLCTDPQSRIDVLSMLELLVMRAELDVALADQT